MATTAICNSFKAEVLQAAHCFNATYTPAASGGTNAAFTLTGLTSVLNISVGMAATGTNVGASAVVSKISSQSSVTVDVANTGTVTSGTVVFTGDLFKIALVIVSPTISGGWGAAQTNYGSGSGSPTNTNMGTDEVTGTGYTAGGQALASNITPALSSSTATTQWTVNPSWTSSTFSTTAAFIYNASTLVRMGATANGITGNAGGSAFGRAVSVHDFGGTQTVSSGTLTLTMPTNNSSNALLRIS